MPAPLSDDGRWIIVDGRRWRASDPSIPPKLRAELVHELMAARRAVGQAGADETAERRARARVQDAKLALGERGDPWWEEPTDDGRRARVQSTIRALVTAREPEKTICPSDVARVVGGDSWRGWLDAVRDEVRALAGAGEVEVRQRGTVRPVDEQWRGPIRIGRPSPTGG